MVVSIGGSHLEAPFGKLLAFESFSKSRTSVMAAFQIASRSMRTEAMSREPLRNSTTRQRGTVKFGFAIKLRCFAGRKVTRTPKNAVFDGKKGVLWLIEAS